MTLEIVWFCAIAFLWTGYLVLEGFDFGVGMLLPLLGRSERDRDTMFESIGPVWDGNEVWLLVAGGATFAAFPVWYATMFSGFYLALVLVLLLLISRVVSFEWRERSESARWRATWTWVNTSASVGTPLLWGIALTSLLYGTPLTPDQGWAGSLADLFSWYSLLGGIALVALFALHGAAFLALRTTGDLLVRSRALAGRVAPVAAILGVAFLVATLVVGIDRNDKSVFPGVLVVLAAAACAVGAVLLSRTPRAGLVFAATTGTIALATVALFTMLYPRLMVASNDAANSLTIDNAASGSYTLKVMTVAVVALLPVVLLYQAWTYHVFRARLGLTEQAGNPIDLIAADPAED